jgi:hypothetical protein
VEEGKAGLASGIINVCRQIGTAFGIAFLGVFLTNHYNAAVSHSIVQLHAPHVQRAQEQRIVRAIEKAGSQAGSSGLAQAPQTIKKNPLFPQISKDTRAAWIESFALTMKISAGFVGLGALVSLLMIRKSDLREEGAGGDQRSGKRFSRTSSA